MLLALADLEGTLDAGAELPLYGLSDREVEDALVRAYALIGRLGGTLVLPLVRQADIRDLAGFFGTTNTAALLRDLLRVSAGAAKRLVTLAATLDGKLAATGQALADGWISVEHAAAISKALDALPAEAAGLKPKAEAHLLGECARFDPQVITRLGRRLHEVLDPDGADELLRKRLEREERAAAEAAELRLLPVGDGRVRLDGWLDTEGAEIVRTALDPLAAPRPTGPDGPDTRPHAHRMADALVELARRSLLGGQLPENGGQRPTLVVTVDYDTLTKQVGSGLLDSGEVLSPEAVRRLACDARILPAVLGGESQPLDVGKAQRTITGSLRRALVLRDKGCAFPSCDRPPQWCDGHHVVSWSAGGDTALNNSVLLCGYHHTLIHHGGWTITITPTGIPEFTPPSWVDPQQRPIRAHHHQPRPG